MASRQFAFQNLKRCLWCGQWNDTETFVSWIMNLILTILLLTISLIPLRAQSPESQAALLQLEKLRSDAVAAHDEPFLAGLYDETYRGVNASGQLLTKPEQLIAYKSLDTHISFSNEEVTVTVYGNMAVVTGVQVARSKGGSILGQTRYLFIYMNVRDKWRIVEGQETYVIKK